MDLARALTESPNPASQNLDRMSALEICTLMHQEDYSVMRAMEQALKPMGRLVEGAAERLSSGGRLFYVGAGTSGRLGMLDAAECPPTFGTPPELVQALLAGGPQAFLRAVEEAEDNPQAAAQELDARGLGPQDVVVGISASGRTPFALGGVARARQVEALTGGIYCNPGAPLEGAVDHPILLAVGPEVLTGSTRLKAGTATKLALNMLSTAVMVRLGRCLGNLMVDLTPTCEKLRDRSVRILSATAGVSVERARMLLDETGGDLREAVQRARKA